MKQCLVCKKVIVDKKHPNRIYCSSKCQHHSQKRQIIKHCLTCKKRLTLRLSEVRKNNFCSNKCYGIFKKGHTPWNKGTHITNKGTFKKRRQHPLWKGGRRRKKSRNGVYYILILKPNHPNCDVMGYVLEHRLVMEKHLGRYLKPTEVVHHIDGNGLNNNINNLILFPNISSHSRFHGLIKNNLQT